MFQVREILPILRNSNAILSIFSGRIFDIGLDAAKIFSEMTKYIHENWQFSGFGHFVGNFAHNFSKNGQNIAFGHFCHFGSHI